MLLISSRSQEHPISAWLQPLPEDRYVQIERKEKLRSAILRLRPDFRDVVELQRTQEYSVKELAQVLGISLSAAKSRLSRARMALRASLRRNSFEA
jgi:RNA polymerase sigma-70 factor, ECF subfamily